jgi:hypothetical protein
MTGCLQLTLRTNRTTVETWNVRGGVCGVLMEHFSANLKVIERQNLFLRSPRPFLLGGRNKCMTWQLVIHSSDAERPACSAHTPRWDYEGYES